MNIKEILYQTLRLGISSLLVILLLGNSTIPLTDNTEQVRAFTRDVEFDFIGWTLNALGIKIRQIALGGSNYISDETQHQLVLDYLQLTGQIQQLEAELRYIYGDPNVQDAQAASIDVRQQLDELYDQRDQIAPLAEAVLQNQLGIVAADLGLTLGGQSIPPALFHSTPLPWSLIVSPRDEIVQLSNINLIPELTVDEHVTLEEQVDQALDVSSLVVGIGGVGTYPTMINQTSSLNWLSEVIAHEWTHNYLTLRPLGINYLTSPELRTMNETAASIAGREIGLALLERFYPEFVPPPEPPVEQSPEPTPEPEPPAFDFNAEMRETRVNVDNLLAEGRIEQAEEYMEMRRAFFWDNGYRIRKLNQAFFAFFGAYADVPGGAAGEDPVGAAVRELRSQSPSLAAFLNRISWMASFERLQSAVGEPEK